jgi:hypothetical protein
MREGEIVIVGTSAGMSHHPRLHHALYIISYDKTFPMSYYLWFPCIFVRPFHPQGRSRVDNISLRIIVQIVAHAHSTLSRLPPSSACIKRWDRDEIVRGNRGGRETRITIKGRE